MPNNNPDENLHRYTNMEANNAMMGQNGWEIVDDTSAHTTGYNFIMCITSCVFSDITATNSDDTGIGSITFPPNFLIAGNITSFTLTSGDVIAYKSGVPA